MDTMEALTKLKPMVYGGLQPTMENHASEECTIQMTNCIPEEHHTQVVSQSAALKTESEGIWGMKKAGVTRPF